MKLYYSPGACSLAVNISLREAGKPFDLELVDLRAHKTASGADYYGINPKGYVPDLELDDGQRLTEIAAIVQYVADLAPEKKLAPANGSFERYRLQEWLNFIATEIHKQFSPLFSPNAPDEWKKFLVEKINGRFELVAKHLEGKQYLMGDQFTVADAYLYVMLNWSRAKARDVLGKPGLQAYFDRVQARPGVQAALESEGLKK